MTPEKKNRSDGDRLGRAFREGSKRAYGKVFWRWVDTRRGKFNTNKYCLEVLDIFPSTYSVGRSTGAFCLENMIHVLLKIGVPLQEAPALPDQRVMQMMGLQRAMAALRNESIDDLSLIQLCYVQILVMGTQTEVKLWHAYQGRIKQSREAAQLAAWRKTVKDLEQKIVLQVERFMTMYFQSFPEERPTSPTSHLRDCNLVWETYGSDLQSCCNALSDISWIEVDA